MKRLIFLLFIALVSSQSYKKGLIDRTRYCKGGKLQNGKCKCPNSTALFKYECKPCIGGSIKSGRCKCPKGKFLKEMNVNY